MEQRSIFIYHSFLALEFISGNLDYNFPSFDFIVQSQVLFHPSKHSFGRGKVDFSCHVRGSGKTPDYIHANLCLTSKQGKLKDLLKHFSDVRTFGGLLYVQIT